MSKRRVQWDTERYKVAVQGDPAQGFPGLRSIGKGFDPSHGYDLRHIDEWSPARKRRVRETYERVHFLLAQKKRIVRPRGKKTLNTLQQAFHGDTSSRGLRVAFIPDLEPESLPGAKRKPARVRIRKSGVVIEKGPYSKIAIPFDRVGLARDPRAEVKRALSEHPRARLFFVQAGQFQMANGYTAGTLANRVADLMMRYNGKRPLPAGSGNAGDDPRYHKWDLWLSGAFGYEFPKNVDIAAMARQIGIGMQNAKARRLVHDRGMASKKGFSGKRRAPARRKRR